MEGNSSLSRFKWKALHALFGLLILAVSGIPGSGLPAMPGLVPDKVMHFGEFAVFGFLGAFAYRSRRRSFWLLLLFGGAFAGLDEWWQSYVPERNSDPIDFMADLAGHSCGFLVGWHWLGRTPRKKPAEAD